MVLARCRHRGNDAAIRPSRAREQPRTRAPRVARTSRSRQIGKHLTSSNERARRKPIPMPRPLHDESPRLLAQQPAARPQARVEQRTLRAGASRERAAVGRVRARSASRSRRRRTAGERSSGRGSVPRLPIPCARQRVVLVDPVRGIEVVNHPLRGATAAGPFRRPAGSTRPDVSLNRRSCGCMTIRVNDGSYLSLDPKPYMTSANTICSAKSSARYR